MLPPTSWIFTTIDAWPVAGSVAASKPTAANFTKCSMFHSPDRYPRRTGAASSKADANADLPTATHGSAHPAEPHHHHRPSGGFRNCLEQSARKVVSGNFVAEG